MRFLGCVITIPMILAAGGAVGEEKFEKTAVYLEQNIQDKDAEVKFEVIGPNAGLAALQVVAPDGRVVVDFKAPGSKLGIRRLTLESPEPKNDGRLQSDFPAGMYKFTGVTTSGSTLRGEAGLTHLFPKPISIARPRADEVNVPIAGLRIGWSAAKEIEAIAVTIEHEASGREIRVTLSGAATAFAVPDGFLTTGTTYKLAIGAIASGGNRTVTETSFTTAVKK